MDPRLCPVHLDPSEMLPLDRRVALVVEDDVDNLELSRSVLEEQGCMVFACLDGKMALHTLMNEQVIPDVIVLDYGLPGGMNGEQFLRFVTKSLKLTIPTVLISGQNPHDGLIRRVRSYLPKPYNDEDLVRHVVDAIVIPKPPYSSSALLISSL
jgi:CheY-like chemotaxis protein